MNTIYSKGICLLTAVMAFVLLTACSSDDDSYHVPGTENFSRDMIVGEWYEPLGEGSYTIVNYNADGSLNATEIRADKQDWKHSPNNGYWEYSDGRFTVVTTGSSSGLLNGNNKAVYQMKNLTKYEIQLSSLDLDLISGDYRIVDTYQMNVGQSRQAIVNDGDFVPQEYSTVNYHVASVDNAGKIEARHLGTTYILIKSSIGTAVIRVVVNDSENDFDDVLQIMGSPLLTVTKEYGKMYTYSETEDGIIILQYNLDDENVMTMLVQTDTDGYVNRIDMYLSNNITPGEVRASLNRKYHLYKTSNSTNLYITQWQFRTVGIQYSEEDHGLVFYFMEAKNSLEWWDSIFNEVMNNNISIFDLADFLGYEMTMQDYYSGAFIMRGLDYPFTAVGVRADEKWYVDKAQLYFDDYITFQDIEYFFNRYYLPTSGAHTYVSPEYTYFIGYQEGDDGYLQYLQYSKRKTN